MQFFIDSANLDAIKKFADLGIVDGVTTNPTLISKEGVSLEKRIKEITEIVQGPISAEVMSLSHKEMVEEAHKIVKWGKNIYIKIPITEEGLKAIKILSGEGIKTNVTLIFSLAQALLAAKAGATIVSAFVGRLDDIAEDGMSVIQDIVLAFRNYDFKTKVLVASTRHPRHIMDAALIGADICTMPPEVMEKLIKHPLTDKGVQQFLSDWEKVKNIQ